MELMETLVACEEIMQKLDDPLEKAFQSKLNISNNDEDNKNSHDQNPQNSWLFTNVVKGVEITKINRVIEKN